MQKQVWFITGTSSGFGEAFARYALSQGHRVVATARDTRKLEALVAQAPDRVLALPLDVTKAGAAQHAIDVAYERFGRIDVLINNAGYGIVGAVEETSDADLRAIMDTNFFGAVDVMRAAAPRLRAQGSGAVVNISSLGGQLSMPGFGAYSATKFALEGISEALALELAPFGVKVVIVEPGSFRTNLAGAAMQQLPEIAAYADTVGATRDFARGMHQTQEGDPAKAAAALDVALRAEVTPLRLQLGQDAVDMVRNHAEQMLRDLHAWSALAADTRIDA
jgi:NAD(P)-dependent dehydrogenase (short-subunit alcohol dehydrogenase family)